MKVQTDATKQWHWAAFGEIGHGSVGKGKQRSGFGYMLSEERNRERVAGGNYDMLTRKILFFKRKYGLTN